MTATTNETTMFKSIVVGTDFNDCSERAVDMAATMAKATGGELFVVHTFELPSYGYAGVEVTTFDWLTPIREAAQQSLNDRVRGLIERGVHARGVLEIGVAWDHILRVAKDANADLIVVGTHGRRGIAHALLGSVAEKVVRMSPIPVLTVRGAASIS
jgi:nucleotide-binding universal stress UspA family protein